MSPCTTGTFMVPVRLIWCVTLVVGRYLNASQLPLVQAAPGFLSVDGGLTNGLTTAHQQEKHYVKKKVHKKGYGKGTCEGEGEGEGENVFCRLTTAPSGAFCGSAESEWTELERSRTVSAAVRAHRLCDRSHRGCLAAAGGNRGLAGETLNGGFHWGLADVLSSDNRCSLCFQANLFKSCMPRVIDTCRVYYCTYQSGEND